MRSALDPGGRLGGRQRLPLMPPADLAIERVRSTAELESARRREQRRERRTEGTARLLLFTQREDGVLAIAGEIDACTAPLIDEYMGRVDGPTHLDLRAVTFMDSSGLHVLERIQQRCQANDWPLVIDAVSPPVEWLLRLGGCDELFTVRPPEPVTTHPKEASTTND